MLDATEDDKGAEMGRDKPAALQRCDLSRECPPSGSDCGALTTVVSARLDTEPLLLSWGSCTGTFWARDRETDVCGAAILLTI